MRAAEKAVAAARQNRFAADQRYRAGVGTYTEFLLANAQYLSSQINQVNAAYNFRLAVYDVRYQIGE
jgi:outer membrane protein TolC